MKLRLATAAIALPVLLLAVITGPIPVSILVGVAALVAGWELSCMERSHGMRGVRDVNPFVALWPAAIVSIAAARALGALDGSWWPELATVCAGMVLIPVWWMVRPNRAGGTAGRRIAVGLAAGYFGLVLAHAPALRAREAGLDWVLIALLTTFATDTGAYFIGRAFGTHRLAPRISPNKTWEGVFGGILGAVVIATVLVAILEPGAALWAGIPLGLLVAVVGTIGDLAESALKRITGVKDSGVLLPGHGGILDRLDSLAPNLAVVYWFSLWVAN